MSEITRKQATRPRQSTASQTRKAKANAQAFRRRILQWSNPVEFVNNMYGCHTGDGSDAHYFDAVFGQ